MTQTALLDLLVDGVPARAKRKEGGLPLDETDILMIFPHNAVDHARKPQNTEMNKCLPSSHGFMGSGAQGAHIAALPRQMV